VIVIGVRAEDFQVLEARVDPGHASQPVVGGVVEERGALLDDLACKLFLEAEGALVDEREMLVAREPVSGSASRSVAGSKEYQRQLTWCRSRWRTKLGSA
jgi:hypothetical protein